MTAPAPERVARLSYFFPAHNEEANLEGLIEEALEVLPTLAETFEIIAVNDGSRDRTAAIADDLTARHPGIVRAVHHPTNLGYGAALRSGFGAARYELVGFTDGDRQFRVEDVGRLTARLAQADAPDAVVGYRIKRADPLIRTI
jgi:glycosyltransferase involved in cell wall biosynthesis